MRILRHSIRQRAGPAVGRAHTALSGAMVGLVLAAGGAFAAPPGTIPFGVYDPEGKFAEDGDVSIEHIFLPWEGVNLDSLRTADVYARERNRALLVTIEPWAWDKTNVPPETLRRDILSGSHDSTMRTVCRVLATLESPVTVRWGQEMDNSNGHFPWADWLPADSIEAHRRIVGVCRSVAPDLTYMWSPAGIEGMEAYYPGDDVVDVIGLSVFGLQDYERNQSGSSADFADILGPRYDRAVTFGKPIMIAELGYVGNAAYLADWRNSVRQQRDRFAELTAVIYFNRKEVWPWPNGFGLPDWRIGAGLSN